jgi:type VI secretion system protein
MDSNLESHSGIEALCRGAGIDPASIPGDAHAALLSLAGQMIREVVLDLMEALRNRGDIKSRLSLMQTGIQPNQNNPLKLSTSVEDAIRKLLDGNSTRNLGAVEALREAFTDLKNHQMAIDAGTNAALNDLLGRVDPTELQERFDRGLKRNAPQATINKAKYWELFAEFYPLLNQRDTRGWPAVFTEEFTRAYAAKVDELENSRKK